VRGCPVSRGGFVYDTRAEPGGNGSSVVGGSVVDDDDLVPGRHPFENTREGTGLVTRRKYDGHPGRARIGLANVDHVRDSRVRAR
jgi:hypothetical protein